ncbi:hypothetical protein B0I33_104493 [Prauserella shujinwangii]|uniref:Uncharacterized protein n=1 Tax=Prauserella shujinwangii TaxID=1453103 RepID=A0A2T0LXC2_9PSEU|nr:hypothetical protein [Prauserella shujinwangii]PRX48675.1 hypothetical protein B0I33_104493 [Prauserella shujinwangii]
MKDSTAVWPVAAQCAGGISAALGLYLLTGLAWALLAAGAVALAVGTLAEMKGGR